MSLALPLEGVRAKLLWRPQRRSMRPLNWATTPKVYETDPHTRADAHSAIVGPRAPVMLGPLGGSRQHHNLAPMIASNGRFCSRSSSSPSLPRSVQTIDRGDAGPHNKTGDAPPELAARADSDGPTGMQPEG